MTNKADELKNALPAIQEVLKGLSLLPAKEISAEEGTKVALDDLSLAVTGNTQKLIGWGTGTGAGAGLLASVITFAQGEGQVVLAALIVSTALVIAAGVTALARVLDGDVRGRSAVATSAVNARGDVTEKLVEALTAGELKTTTAASNGQVVSQRPQGPTEQQLLYGLALAHDCLKVTTANGKSAVVGTRWTMSDGLELRLLDGTGSDWVAASKITGFINSPSPVPDSGPPAGLSASS